MRMAVKLLSRAGYSIAVGTALALSANSYGAPLALSDSPLFLAAGVQPNLIMAIDDSGSMDNETLFAGNDGAAWWRTGNSGDCGVTDVNSFSGCVANTTGTRDIAASGRLNFNNAGNSNDTWKKYVYLFPNGHSGSFTTARRRSNDANNDHFAIPPLLDYAWARSPNFNVAYFNPASTYRPWVNGGGFTFGDSNPTAAPYDPVFETTVTLNLTRDVAGVDSSAVGAACSNSLPNRGENYYFKVYRGMTLPEGTCFRAGAYPNNQGGDLAPNWQAVRAGGCEVGVNNGCETREGNANKRFTLPSDGRVAIRYFPATFYLPAGTALPADFGYSATPISGGKAPNGAALDGYEIKPTNFASTAQYQAAIQNFANWFTYYRKRHQALRAGLGESFNNLTGLRVDGFTINDPTNVTMRSIDEPASRNALYTKFYQDWVRSGGTPNRTAVAKIIENFRRTGTGAPVTSACQKNFGMLFTDGFSNSPATDDGINGVFGNVDGTQGDPYDDGVSGTLADAVMDAYLQPLRTGAGFEAGKVSVPAGCGANPTTGSLDCNRNLHMNFYAVTLGTRGLLFNSDAPVDPYQAPTPVWPTNFPARHPSAVDDIWHATINGRGQLLNARSPQEISDKLKSVLRTIIDRTSTAAPVSVNSGTVSSDTRVFQAKFSSSNWTGQLQAFRINVGTGDLSTTPVWDASDNLPAPTARNIYTKNSTGATVPFTWSALSADTIRSGQLDADPARAEMILNYLRGDESNEGTGPTQFRRRFDAMGSNKLGDIVSSSPLFVGAPAFRYRDSLESAPYSTYARNNANRRGVVYAGANDGMLHAFYADGPNQGQELFAYIPTPVFSRLRSLAAQDYGHQFFVDGSPSVGDAFFGGEWHTVLTGGLNKGGQGIYAIDITRPTSLTGGDVLWEFTDADDEDLGFTYSQPVIVKLRNGRWAAIFGNGYNSTMASSPDDVNVSTTGNAVLYIVDIASGDLIKKIDTNVGFAQRPAGVNYDNGLATPSVVDIDGDRIFEYAYAGDLYGNMWKFDLSAATDGGWDVAFGGAPLFSARDGAGNRQPITVRPEIARGPFGSGVVVLFGTGKYLEPNDRQVMPVLPQSFYGIIDRDTGPVTVPAGGRNAVLTEQRVLVETNFNGFRLRVTSDNTLGANSGWFMDLLSPPSSYQGERQVSNPTVRNGAVIFTTLIPDADPCGSGGSSWLMTLDVLDGGRLDVSQFDFTNDGEFTSEDFIQVTLPDGTTALVPATGVGSDQGIQTEGGFVQGDFGEGEDGKPVQYVYLPGTDGTVQKLVVNPGIAGTGRQSWRQVR